MAELKTILAATDLSSASALAVDRGLMLARNHHAKYTLIHALGSDVTHALRSIASAAPNIEELSHKILEQTRQHMHDMVSQCPNRQNVDVELVIQADSATTAIPAYAKQIHADLLVVGAHGTGLVQRTLIGSTATRLVRQAHCPVLVVKQPAHDGYRRALVAVDFSALSTVNIELVQRLAPNAHLVLVHAFEVPFEGKMQMAGVSEAAIAGYREEARVRASAELEALAKQCQLPEGQYTVVASHGLAASDILALEQKYRCDLVVLGKHGTHATTELFLGSVTQRVLAGSQSDVLVSTDDKIFYQRPS